MGHLSNTLSPWRIGNNNPSQVINTQIQMFRLDHNPLVKLITGDADFSQDTDQMTQAKLEVMKKRRKQLDDDSARIQSELNAPIKRSVDLAKENRAYSWLMALNLEDQGLDLYKSAFLDALALLYTWLLDRISTRCACNEPFTVEHALSCPKGAIPNHQHNEIWDITYSLRSEVSHDVTLEPTLQPLDGHTLRYASAITDEGARADIQAKGFWGTSHQSAFFDVKVPTHTIQQEIFHPCLLHPP